MQSHGKFSKPYQDQIFLNLEKEIA